METDFVVVGAGAAGCVLAARLSADPGLSVVLLEAGTTTGAEPDSRMPGGALQLMAGPKSWGDLTTRQRALGGRPVGMVQGRGLGGGSSMNMMAWFHGRPEDYDGWQAQGATGWSWSDVRPALRALEDNDRGASDRRGTGGPIKVSGVRDAGPLPLSFVAGGAEHGLPVVEDFNGPAGEGVGLIQSNIRDGRRHSVIDGYLAPARGRDNLTVLTGQQVTSVLLHGNRAVGVRAGDTEYRARRGVVLSAGAARTPQLLLLSGIGPAGHLTELGIPVAHDLPGVGANLQDHPVASPIWPVLDGSPLWNTLTETDFRDYQLLRRGPLSGFTQAAAMLRTDERRPVIDLQVTLILVGVTPAGALIEEPVVTVATSLLDPASRGTIRLAGTDPTLAPLIDPGYLTDPGDRARLRAGLRLVRGLFRSPALVKATGGDPREPRDWSDEGLDAWLNGTLGSEFHLAGSCRMGADPGSVVDPATMAVHGLTGLFVADASVMPTVTRGNPQAPTIMIAERAAQRIPR